MSGTYERRRNIVHRPDGKRVNVARSRGHLFVCRDGCCCGRVDEGMPAAPYERYESEWERRRLRNRVHLTVGGCLGPCALANVALLLIDGRARWLQSLNDETLVDALFDWIDALLDDADAPPPATLAPLLFTASAWQDRPDGTPVDDLRPRRPTETATTMPLPEPVCDLPAVDRAIADMAGDAAAPRKNGELQFAEPWEGRAFGMAVALHEGRAFDWEEFRGRLIAEIDAVEREAGETRYYESWLAAFERVLTERGIVSPAELDERTFQFEFGERDEVF